MNSIEKGSAAAPAGAEYAAHSEMLSNPASDFSLFVGGPLYQFLLRVGLLKPPLERVGWRVIIITLIAWAPLLVFTALSSRTTSGVKVPFFYDVEVQARFLVAFPLLIGAEVTIHKRLRSLLVQFVERQIISPNVITKFEGCIDSALRLRNSAPIELGLLVFVVVVGQFWSRMIMALPTNTWYATVTGSRNILSPAGYWYFCVSLPIVQFVAFRWYFRLLVWGRLLWHVSRLELDLVPSHPDRRCGLGFLGYIVLALGPFILAHSVLLAGYLANRILYEGIRFTEHGAEIAVVTIFLSILALGPLCVFTPRLIQQRREGLRTYGSLASDYVIAFEKKWMQGRRPGGEALVGTSDIQSLADLASSFDVVQRIVPFPFGREAVVTLAVLIAMPILPLTLTMFSIQELAAKLMKVLM